MKTRIIFISLWTAFWLLLNWLMFLPTLSFAGSPGIYFDIIVYSIVAVIISYNHSDEEWSTGSTIFTVIGSIAVLIFLVITIFGSSAMFNSGEYQSLIGKIEETKFTSTVQAVAPDQMIIVDAEMAKKIGEKELGSDPGLGSRVTLGDFTLQAVGKKLYWIAPLVHSGFWRWNRFGNVGTPGYIRVSAINQEDYAMITLLNGKSINLKYQPEAFFGQDLERLIYTSGYSASLFSDYTFEVDDNWNPFWTVTIYDSKIGFDGDDATAVLTINPIDGKIAYYDVNSAPNWIDRIQPEDFVSEQVDDWGHYIHGYWNWSGQDKIRVAGEHSLVLGKDGRSYFYLGLTSNGQDNSTVGFVMVDTRTKKATWFKQAGATETAAKSSAEGKVQEKGYTGSEGITYNIGGYATYEFLLKDKGGLMKLIALVNVHDHTIVGVGENRHEAIQDYRSQMTNRGNNVSVTSSDMEKVFLESQITRFANEVIKGNTFYYFILNHRPKTIFTSGPNISSELVLTKAGDMVQVSFIENKQSGEISLLTFDNLAFLNLKDSIQIKLEKQVDAVRDTLIQKKSNEALEDKWEKLSPEEKRKLMKKN